MYTPPKLTKKQKKSLAFRGRTTGKRHVRNGLIEMETTAVPVMEDQDIASMHSGALEDTGNEDKKKRKEVADTVRVSDQDKGKVASKGKGRTEEKDVSVSVEVVKTTKRKRTREDGAQEDQTSEFQSRKVLKRKKGSDVTQSSETGEKTAVKQRFILFVGSHFFNALLNELRFD